MSRSIRRRAFSARKRTNSSSRTVRLPWPGNACWPCADRASFHFRNVGSPIPNDRAASANERPETVTKSTADRLYSAVNFRRTRFDLTFAIPTSPVSLFA